MTGKRLPPDDPRVRRIKEAAREGRIPLASQSVMSRVRKEINEILEALGFSGALVTDESCISDFLPAPEDLRAAEIRLGISISCHDSLTDTALRLRDARGIPRPG